MKTILFMQFNKELTKYLLIMVPFSYNISYIKLKVG